MQLNADTVQALRLDPTGRDGDPRFPYTLENLTDRELLALLFVSEQATAYADTDDVVAAAAADYVEDVRVAVDTRFGVDRVERLASWVTGMHASHDDMIAMCLDQWNDVVAIMADHHHFYRFHVSDWWCRECDTVTDYCTQQN